MPSLFRNFAPPNPVHKPMYFHPRVYLFIVLLTSGLLGGCGEHKAPNADLKKGGFSKDARKKPMPVEVQVVGMAPLLSQMQTTGTLVAGEEVTLQSEVAGRITAIRFEEGRPVRKGDLLVQIFDEDLRATLEKLKVREKTAAEQERRQRELRTLDAISQEVYERTLLELESARADIRVQEVQLTKTQVRAPFDGVVGLRQVSEGGYLTMGSPIARLQSLNPIKMEATLPEKYLPALRAGDVVTFTVEGIDQTYSGTVYAIDPQVDPATRTFRFRARCANPGLRLVPGAFAKVQVRLGGRRDALVIPTQALIPDLGGFKVFVVKNGQAEAQAVKLGERTDAQVEIVEGLTTGDSLIVSGILQVRPGQPVKVLKPASTPAQR